MKKLIPSVFFAFIVLGLSAQDLNVPRDYELKTKEDYARYQPDLLSCITWIMNTPVEVKPEKRKEANAFVVKWITGSPDVSIELKPEIVNFMEPNHDLLVIFLSAWTKYSIENNDYKNKLQGNLKGVEAVIDFYKKNREHLSKDKNVEKYMKMKEKGDLENIIAKNI